jgi:hypothetical protein
MVWHNCTKKMGIFRKVLERRFSQARKTATGKASTTAHALVSWDIMQLSMTREEVLCHSS